MLLCCLSGSVLSLSTKKDTRIQSKPVSFFPKQNGKRTSNLKLKNSFKRLLNNLNFSHILIKKIIVNLLLLHAEQLYKGRNRAIKLAMSRAPKLRAHKSFELYFSMAPSTISLCILFVTEYKSKVKC